MDLTDQQIIDLYNDPKTGLIGKYDFARKFNIPIKRVDSLLQSVDSYNLNVPPKNAFNRRKVVIYQPRLNWEMDLQDLSSNLWAPHNNGYLYILCLVDQFSRYAYCQPLKTKTPDEVLAAFKKILKYEDPNLNEFQQPPKTLICDRGTEFEGVFAAYCQTNNIKIWHPTTKIKAPIVERFNLTLKLRIGRLVDAKTTYKWVDHLQDLVHNYNNTKHRVLKMTPLEANDPRNIDKVNEILDKQPQKRITKKDYLQIGDFVRIPYDGVDIFTRSHHTRQSIAVYKIKEMNKDMYILEDNPHRGPPRQLFRHYYANELTKVTEPVEYKIDKVIRTEYRRVNNQRVQYGYIHWQGYPNNERFNTWEPMDNIRNLIVP